MCIRDRFIRSNHEIENDAKTKNKKSHEKYQRIAKGTKSHSKNKNIIIRIEKSWNIKKMTKNLLFNLGYYTWFSTELSMILGF